MMTLDEIIRQMNSNAEAIRALIGTISEQEALWKPNPESWCLKEVMEHVYNEERLDFRQHLMEMLHDPPQAWGPGDDSMSVETCRQALDGFLAERKTSILWLSSQEGANWDTETASEWRTLQAGEVLVSWVEHDFLHMRQMIEVLYAWNEDQAKPYSVQYAGGW
jgi:hypothetical protein